MPTLLAIGFAVTACKHPYAIAEYQGYAKALERSLQFAEVLTRPTTHTLAALAVYLLCGRLHMRQDYLECMLLLLVRMAVKLKLNRDPSMLGFEAGECEFRRRLWWQIVALDVRTAEACGSTPVIERGPSPVDPTWRSWPARAPRVQITWCTPSRGL